MRGIWCFAQAYYDQVEQTNNPDWPAGFPRPGMRADVPGDIRRMLPDIAPADHVHTLLGAIALPNDTLTDGGDPHHHFCTYYSDAWRQITMNGAEHEHALNLSTNGLRYLPDYFMLFVSGEDQDIADLVTSGGWYLIGDVSVAEEDGVYTLGPVDDTTWTQQEQNQWANRMDNLMGLELPSQVSNPRRFVHLFLGAFLLRDVYDESHYRHTTR